MSTDYIVSGSDLTSIANSIREKAGTSGSLAFPAGFAEAIAGISGGIKVAYGSLIPASNITKKYALTHSLGVVPKYFIIYGASSHAAQDNWYLHYAVGVENGDVTKQINLYRSSVSSEVFSVDIVSNAITGNISTSYFNNATSQTIEILSGSTAYGNLKSGYVYEWIAIG